MSGQRHAPAALPRERHPVPIAQEAGKAPEPLWTGAENLGLTGIRSLDDAARSELHLLIYDIAKQHTSEMSTNSTECSVSLGIHKPE